MYFIISTAEETKLFSNKKKLKDKKITAEVCIHHLWFSDSDYEEFGSKIKWNPAVKSSTDRDALVESTTRRPNRCNSNRPCSPY